MHTRFSYFEDLTPVHSSSSQSKRLSPVQSLSKFGEKHKKISKLPRAFVAVATMGMIPTDKKEY